MPQDTLGRYTQDLETRADAAIASAARTTSGVGTAFATPEHTIAVTVTCTARSGTSPTLDVTVETTTDGTNYHTVATFTQMTNTGAAARSVSGLGSSTRIRWAIGGSDTPSFTFSVAVQRKP